MTEGPKNGSREEGCRSVGNGGKKEGLSYILLSQGNFIVDYSVQAVPVFSDLRTKRTIFKIFMKNK